MTQELHWLTAIFSCLKKEEKKRREKSTAKLKYEKNSTLVTWDFLSRTVHQRQQIYAKYPFWHTSLSIQTLVPGLGETIGRDYRGSGGFTLRVTFQGARTKSE